MKDGTAPMTVNIVVPSIPASERPEAILEVLDNEIPPKDDYVCSSELTQQQILEKLEQDRLFRESNSDMAERALQMMMDGKLELSIVENTADQELQPPDSYYKEKSKLTESEIKEIKEYENKVKLKKEVSIKYAYILS